MEIIYVMGWDGHGKEKKLGSLELEAYVPTYLPILFFLSGWTGGSWTDS